MATIPQKDLRDNVAEILRRAEAGEEITITVADRPVAQLGPATQRRWVRGPALQAIWRTPTPRTLDRDLERFPAPLADPLAQLLRALIDASVLIGDESPPNVEAAISVVSIAELYCGVLVAVDADERGRRTARLGVVESTFDPLPITDQIAREWGRLSAAVSTRGGKPRRRTVDLVIAATANVHGVPLLTHNIRVISDLVDLRHTSDGAPA